MDRGQHNTLLICTFDPDYELSSVLQGAKEKSRENRGKESILPACDSPGKLPMQETSTRQCIETHFTHTRAVLSNTSCKSSQKCWTNRETNTTLLRARSVLRKRPIFLGDHAKPDGEKGHGDSANLARLVGDAPRRISAKLDESIHSQSGGGATEWVKVYYGQASRTIRISNHRPDLHGSHPSTPH